MRRMIGNYSVVLGVFAVVCVPIGRAGAELPPKVLADKYLMQADLLVEKEDYKKALSLMDTIKALQKEHNLPLQDEFHFKYAQIAFSEGSLQRAVDAASAYLTKESRGEHYKEALAILIRAEQALKDCELTPEEMCTGKQKGASCWRVLNSPPRCHFWDADYDEKWTLTWSGYCLNGRANGVGSVSGVWNSKPEFSGNHRWDDEHSVVATGRLWNGKFHGHVSYILTESRFTTVGQKKEMTSIYIKQSEGVNEYGKPDGTWVYRTSFEKGSVFAMEKGGFVHGRKHGTWLWFRPSVRPLKCFSSTYHHGERVAKQEVDMSMCVGW